MSAILVDPTLYPLVDTEILGESKDEDQLCGALHWSEN